MYISLFDKIKKPTFLNESNNTKEEIEYLKSIIDKAPKDIKEKIVNVDNLYRKIILENEKAEDHISEKNMIELANFYLDNNKDNPKRYFEKYKVEEKLICPKCGNELVKRKSTKGEHIGEYFYGCKNYPKCRYIKNI